MPAEYVDLVITLVRENLWFSQVSFWAGKLGTLFDNVQESRVAFGELMMTLFNTPQRPRLLTKRSFASDGKSSDGSSPLQLGTIDLNCDHTLTYRDFNSMCSAIVTNQTARNVSMYLDISSTDDGGSRERWKWLAYAFFSKRTRGYSSLYRLEFTSLDSMTVEDMEGFSTIMASEHPEEDLCGTPRGLVEE